MLLTAAVRLHPFLEGNDDGDVGTYILGGRALLHGVLPYATVWEFKPPGLFALYALALALCGDGSRAAALLGLIAAIATTLLIWRFVARVVPDGERAALAAAVLWACTSIEDDGLLGDAELLAIPFAVAALFVLAARVTPGRIALAGLLAAGAAQMKLSAALFAIVPLVVIVRAGGFRTVAPFALAFAAPLACEAALYAFAGRFAELWDANAGATLRRIGSRPAVPAAPHVGDQFARLSPALELALFAPLRRNPWLPIIGLWLLTSAVALVAAGEYDARQWLPLLPPLAIFGGIGLDAIARRTPAPAGIVAVACVLAFGLHGYFELNSAVRTVWMRDVRGERDWRISDADRLVGELRVRGVARDTLWVVEKTPRIYDELGVAPPTRYPLTSNLFNRTLWPMLGFSGPAELDRILDLARPRWIVVGTCGVWCDAATRDATYAKIRADYARVAQLDASTVLYQRK
ncbi:MAG: glycosyltransferase family 39 protein [Candidatus Eremiobacteraeota bacterium]|nr:glycosyltransferase family 39 protein [Candidatus Eremiobacteraeota bacterium]